MNQYVGKPVTAANFLPKVINRLKTIGLEFWLFVLKIVGLIPIHSLRTIFYLISGVKMPLFGSVIHLGASFFEPNGITIGRNTVIGYRSFLDGRGKLKIGNHVDIASEVMIYTNEHDVGSEDFSNSFAPVTVGDYVFIGPRSIILPGVTIGKGAVVAAGAIVTKNIPEGEIWGGVPAQKIKDRPLKSYHYRLGRPMLFQ